MKSISKFTGAFLLAIGCSHPGPPAVAPRAAAPSFVPFGFGKTEPARKAKFEALVPRLDELFRKKLEEAGGTGLAVGILLDAELVYARGFGVADVKSGRPVDEHTVFRVASVSKGFTALAALKLRDEGKLALDEPIARYLPELSRLRGPTHDSPPITARLLLTNAAGFAYDDLWGAVTFGKSDEELLRFLEGGSLFTTAPGTKYAYANLGWALLGQIIGRVSGLPFREYATRNIFLPLGMRSSVWEAWDVPAGRLATGYHREAGQLVADVPASDGAFAAAGGLYTSLHDLTRYVAFHALAYPPRDAPESVPVRRSTLREMHQGQRWMRWFDKNAPVAERTEDGIRLQTAAYGFGWFNATTCGEEGRASHGGYEPGYYANVTVLPESGVAFAFLATTGSAPNPARAGALALLREAGLLDKASPTAQPALAEARASIEALLAGWDDARFRRTFDPDSLRYSWNTRVREDFALLGRTHGRCRGDGGLTTASPLHGEFRLTCERGAIRFDLLVAPGPAGRLQNAQATSELPLTPAQEQASANWLSLLQSFSEPLAAELFAPSVDLVRARKTLLHLAIDHGACTPVRGRLEIAREPVHVETRSVSYELACREKPLELRFTQDETTGKVTSFAAHPPRAADAVCWQ
jgi:CubicO group peptidase (beta-lactamase class C family)